jgi:hypothetical protein
MLQITGPNSGNTISFWPNNELVNGTHLIGYYYPRVLIDDTSMWHSVDKFCSIYTLEENRPADTFTIMCAKLYRLLGKSIFVPSKCQDKSAIHISLKYNDCLFYLYDYKGDACFHIGGNNDGKHLIHQLAKDLDGLLANTKPKKFKHKSAYTGFYYRYK